jgi:serine/threonine-protein kinase HipA
MNRCPILYTPCGDNLYSEKGLKLLAHGLTELKPFEYTAEDQRAEAYIRASKMSIQGVQPKLSSVLSIKKGRFEIVDRGGKYILKPQHHIFPQMPENEDLTMKMAELAGLEVPLHGMIRSIDNSLTYFIKRFDREGQAGKVAVEDFAQLAGLSRDTKYNYSMEKLVKLLDRYCSFPAVDKVKLFKRVLFCFLTGNEDMHLKNFSIINRDGKIELSPCYDLVNTTIELKEPDEEIALTLQGKKKNLTKNILVDYFGREICGITGKVVDNVMGQVHSAVPEWTGLIDSSYLSAGMKEKYHALLNSRLRILFR